MPSAAAHPAQPARRTVLQLGLTTGGAGLLLGVGGCRLRVGSPGSGGGRGGSSPSATGSPSAGRSANQAALDTAADTAQQLEQLYVLAGQVRPDLAVPLARLAADHTAHLRSLAELGAEPGTTSASPAPSGSTTTAPTSSTTTAPTGSTTTAPTGGLAPTRVTALSVLAQAERAAVTSGRADLASLDGRTARLMASIAACSSAHLALLARLPAAPAGSAPATATKKAGA
jgi:hypothetical protein